MKLGKNKLTINRRRDISNLFILEIHCLILAILVLNLTIILSITTFVVNRHTAKLEATTRKYNSILKRKIRKIIVPTAHVTIII